MWGGIVMKFKINVSKKLLVIVATTILILTISLTVQPKENPNFFEKCINTVFLPIQQVIKWPFNKMENSIDFFVDMKNLAEENERLNKENIELKERVRQLEIDGIENSQLRDMLNLTKKYETSNAIVAEVISMDSSIWFDVFTINKGEKDGIKNNMTVLTPQGLVGKVTQTFSTTAQVTSILDVNNAVSARLTKTGDLITTKGDMNLVDKGLLKLKYVTSDVNLAEGDVVETSGMGGIYPKGIFIGTISKVEQDNKTMKTYAVLEPGVDFNKISEVLVISNMEGE